MITVVYAAASLILAASDSVPQVSPAELAAQYCSVRGSQPAFEFVQSELRKKDEFWNQAEYRIGSQRHRGNCRHEVSGSAVTASTGLTRFFIAEATYNQETDSWQLDLLNLY